MSEPAVTLTDYALAVECAAFAWLVATHPAGFNPLRRWLVLFFACTALAAFFGGTVHGFFHDSGNSMSRGLWVLSLLAIGITALAGWVIAARLLLAPDRADVVVGAAIAITAAYATVVLLVSDAFWVAVVGYLPAALLLFVAFLRAAVRQRRSWARRGAWGVALSFVAAAVQQGGIGVHPVYFDHNALYHVIQAVALALLFLGGQGLLDAA